MQRARDPAEFLQDPIGRCLVGDGFAVWCDTPELCGTISWGKLVERGALALSELLDFVRHPKVARRYDVLMDTRAIETVDAEVLLRFGDAIKDRLPEWSARIRRQVVVIPEGLSGVMLAGLVTSLDSSFPVRFVATLEEAFAQLDGTNARAAFAAAEELVAESRARSTVIERVRAQLVQDPVNATLPSVARALGSSARTLQRELHQADTSFSDELRHVRVTTASQLLAHTENKIEAIALRVGFGTASRMSVAFRRQLGLTPSELRARRK